MWGEMDDCALYTDPTLYDTLFPQGSETASEQFYLEEARRGGGVVLDLGCGSGRLSVGLAQAGVDIVGLDLSESMLEVARAKAAVASVAIRFIHGDMRSFELPERFSAILIPGNSLLHLHAIADLQGCLSSVRRHLAPGGRLVFDISKWDLGRLVLMPGERYQVMQRGGLSIEETSTYDSAEQVRTIRWHFVERGVDVRTVEYRLRVIFPQELVLLLESRGLGLESRFGSFEREPFDSSSRRQVCVCRAPNS